MGLRAKWVIAAAALLLMGAIGTGTSVDGPISETSLTTGHTVFVRMPSVDGSTSRSLEFAAAVAVLVREHQDNGPKVRAPGVLWFNDQYLTVPLSPWNENVERYPCKGSVLAVEAGDPDPRGYLHELNDDTYVASYHITDPNGRGWDIDKWSIPKPGRPILVWSVALMNNAQYAGETDLGQRISCAPVRDMGCMANELNYGCPGARDIGGVTTTDPYAVYAQPAYPCGTVESPCAGLRYNALLFFSMSDLVNSGAPRDHSPGSDHATGDATACHGDAYPCPDGDDTREGNSHPFHPENALAPAGAGHEPIDGGSADCDGDGRVDLACHRTVDVDVYYGRAPTPTVRTYDLYDAEAFQGWD